MKFSKNIITLIYSLLALAVLGAAALVLFLTGNEPDSENSSVQDEASEYPRVVTEHEITDVVSISIRNKHDEFVIIQPAAGVFDMPVLTALGAPLNQNRLESAARSVSRFRLQALVAEDADDLEQFGLGDDAAWVKAEFSGGEVFEVFIGDEAPLAEAVNYVRIAGSNNVYTVFTSAVNRFMEDRRSYVALQLTESHENLGMPLVERLTVEYADGEIYNIELIPAAGEDEIAVTFNLHRMTEPYRVELSLTESHRHIHGLFGLTAAGVIYAGENAEEILGESVPILNVEMDIGGMTVNFMLGGEAVQNEDGETGVIFQGIFSEIPNVIYTFAPSALPWLSFEVEQIIAMLFHTPMITNVSDLIIEGFGYDLHFTLTGEIGADEDFYMNGVLHDDRAFRLLYQFAISAPTEAPFRGDADDIENMPLIARYTYRYRGDRAEDIIEFRDSGDLRVVTTRNGEPMFSSRNSYIQRLEQNLELFINNEPIIFGW
jgi:hypothetical protein